MSALLIEGRKGTGLGASICRFERSCTRSATSKVLICGYPTEPGGIVLVVCKRHSAEIREIWADALGGFTEDSVTEDSVAA